MASMPIELGSHFMRLQPLFFNSSSLARQSLRYGLIEGPNTKMCGYNCTMRSTYVSGV